MLLSCRPLVRVVDANEYTHAQAIEWHEGDAPAVYIQLIDASRDNEFDGFQPSGRRYVPEADASLKVILSPIKVQLGEIYDKHGHRAVERTRITRHASQPFSQDGSIWKFLTLKQDKLKGTISLILELTEGDKVTYARVPGVIRIRPMGGI